ncbi:MAG: hypothetical protein DRJ47_11395, partial [Thermoprotei archaeon]
MTILDEVIAKSKEIFNELRYSIPRLPYTDADYTRNLWIIAMKRAIREVLREHKPYKNPYLLTSLSLLISACIMRLYSCPSLKSYYDMKIDDLYDIAKYGITYANNLAIYGMGLKQKLLTYGMG